MTKILTESGIKKLWSKIKAGFLSLSGGTVNGDVNVGGVLTCTGNGVELFHKTPFIDFHYGNSNKDYDVRIRNNVSGGLQFDAPTLIDFVGPLKSSGGRLWITLHNENIFDAKISEIDFYKKSYFLQMSRFYYGATFKNSVGGNSVTIDVGGNSSTYALDVNGKTHVSSDVIIDGNITVKGKINLCTGLQLGDADNNVDITMYCEGDAYDFDLGKAIELGILKKRTN